MIVWSTQFPVLPNRSIEDLLTLSAKWLTGSPHTIWKPSEIPQPVEGTIQIREKSGQAVKLARIDSADGKYGGFRHEWTDLEGRCWTTEICGRQTPTQYVVGVRLDCATEASWVERPRPKKPYIVRQLLAELGGDLDGEFFQVDSHHRRLAESELDLATRIVLGEAKNRLPVVYFSSTWQDSPVMDDRTLLKLAQELGGMAHVVIEPNRRFSFLLANESNRRNPYEGVIAVFWPDSGGRSIRLFPEAGPDTARLFGKIVDTVRDALATTRPDYATTWDNLLALLVRRRIEGLRNKGEIDIAKWAREFDQEIALKEKQLKEANDRLKRMTIELAQREQECGELKSHALSLGSETELYHGELMDVLAIAFKAAMERVQPDGRVRDLLKSLALENEQMGEGKRLQDEIKRALHGDSNLGPKERRALERLGFSITDDGKHLKLVFRNDDRYTFALPKTGSDWRGLKNAASDITKRLFK